MKATHEPEPLATNPPAVDSRVMRANSFDRVTSFLLSLILLLTSFVALLFAMWLLRPSVDDVQPPEQVPVRRSVYALSEDQENLFAEPAPEEVQNLAEPTLQETVQAVSTVLVSTTIHEGDHVQTQQMRSDDRSEFPMDGEDIVPRHERWELVFKAANQKSYARQLDAMNIELGVFGGGQQGLDYVSRLSTRPTARHNPNPATEQRLYFSWAMAMRDQSLVRYEQNLVSLSQIAWQGRHLVKFVPQELEMLLADAELEYAQNHGYHSITQIAKTVFLLQRASDPQGSVRFVVTRQRYRVPEGPSVFKGP